MKFPSRFNKKTFLCFFCLTCLYFLDNQANAQTITENQPLSFGKIVLVNNAAPRQIKLFPAGSYTADPEYIFFTDPQLGNITVDGYPPATPLNVTVGVTNLTGGGSPALFSIQSTFTNPASITTDGTGSATFDVGATLISDGSGASFTDNLYDGTYTVTVTP